MKKLILVLALCFQFVAPAQAAVPKLLAYQGVLKDSSGNFLTGAYSMTFRIYSASTGGSSLWSETQSGVSASSGKFSVTLGSVTAISLDFNSDYWLSIQVGADPEMSPRIRLTASAYGIRSDYENNGFTQAQHDALTHENINGVKENSVAIAKTNFKLDAYSLASANSLGELILDTFNDATGIYAPDSLNYTHRGTPNFDVTLTPTGGGILREQTDESHYEEIISNVTHSYNGYGQQFQLASTKTVDKATIKVWKVGSPSGNVRIRLYANNSGTPGTLLAETADIAVSSFPTSYGEVTHSFTSGVSLAANTTYLLVVENINASGDGANHFNIRRSSSDMYSSYVIIAKNSSGAWSALAAASGDLYFKLYEQQTYSGSATVVSNSYTEPAVPTEAMVIADETLGTGSITYYVSRNGGASWTACAKETVTSLSTQSSGTQVKWKAVITGNAELNAIAVAV